jgi:anti-sigma-K factor RskA
MVDTPVTPSHEDWENRLALAVVGTLPTSELALLESHMATCATCREEWAAYRRVTHALDHAIPLVSPPAHLESAILRRIRANPLPLTPRPFRLSVWQGASVAALLVVLLLTVQLLNLNRELSATQKEQAILLDTISSPHVHPLPAITTNTQETVGYFIWAPGIRTGTLTVQALPPHGAQRGYQLWLIRQDGTVDNGGMIEREGDGQGYLQVDAQVPWGQYDQFIITEEPASGSTAPTTTPLVAGGF